MNSLPNVSGAHLAGASPAQRVGSAPEDIRIPSVVEHLVRIFGFKRNEPLYGVDGDRIAAQYPLRGPTGVRGYEEQVPIFILHGRHNKMVAYSILFALSMVVPLTLALWVGRAGMNQHAAHPAGVTTRVAPAASIPSASAPPVGMTWAAPVHPPTAESYPTAAPVYPPTAASYPTAAPAYSPETPFSVPEQAAPPTVRYTAPKQNSRSPQELRMQICTPR